MSFLRSPILAVSPLIIIVLAIILYAMVMILHRHLVTLLLGCFILIAAGLLFLPSGVKTIDVARHVPDRPERLICLVEAVGHGAPFSGTATDNVGSCHFTGHGIGEIDQAYLQQQSRNYIGS